jgi:hypothetical protein
MRLRPTAPAWGRASAIYLGAAALVCALVVPAWSQPKAGAEPVKTDKAGDKAKDKAKKEPKTYDFNALDLNGRNRSPQLLYFLERANEELERASLERRSFIPHMVRSVEEEAL